MMQFSAANNKKRLVPSLVCSRLVKSGVTASHWIDRGGSKRQVKYKSGGAVAGGNLFWNEKSVATAISKSRKGKCRVVGG
jgi:hypothetical protein